jgi:DNA-binding CsgD family transcriptional regulator
LNKTINFFLLFCFLVTIIGIFSCKKHDKQAMQKDSRITVGSEKKADSLYILGRSYSRDSLNQELALSLYQQSLQYYQQTNNREKIAKVYRGIGIAYDYLEDFSKEIAYAKKSYEIFSAIENKRYAGLALDDMGIAYAIIGEIDSSLTCYKKGLELSKAAGDSIEVIEFYQNMGISYGYAGDYKKAIESHLEGLKYCEKIGYVKGIFDMYINLAEDFNDNNEPDNAMRYMEKADELVDEIDDPYAKATFFDAYAGIYYDKEDFKTAAKYYNKCLDVSREINFKRGMACAYSNLSLIAMEEKKYGKAEELSQLSIKLEEEINNTGGIILSLCEIAQWQYQQNFFDKAIIHLNRAEALCIGKGFYDYLSEVHYHFYQAYMKRGNSKMALQHCEKYHEIKDSVASVEVKERIADLEIKYETEKKQKEIELLDEANETKRQKIKARNRLIVSLVLMVMVILGVLLIFRQRTAQKLYRMESDLQKYMLRIKDLENVRELGEPEISSKAFKEKHDLTEREAEVLHLINQGMSNAGIASQLFVSTNTIKYHIKNIYLKLDVKNRVEALNKLKN